jgi:hypothetical protein
MVMPEIVWILALAHCPLFAALLLLMFSKVRRIKREVQLIALGASVVGMA